MIALHGCTQTDSPPAVTRGVNSQVASERLPVPLVPVPLLADPPSLNLSIHWLRGSIPHTLRDECAKWLDQWFGPHSREPRGLWFYDRSFLWDNGARLNYHSNSEDLASTDGWLSLEFPGHSLELYDTVQVAWLMRGLCQFEFRCSRIDLAADDLERTITPRDLYQTVYQEGPGDYAVVNHVRGARLVRRPTRRDFTGFRLISYQTQCHADNGCQYDCVGFGRRGRAGSGKYLRVYDKWLESGGRVVLVRWELELSDERARKAFAAIVERPYEETGMVIGTLIATSVDFPIRDGTAGGKNLDRLERHAFWQTLLNRLGTPDKSALALAVKPKTVAKALGYVSEQAMGTIQMLSVALGRDVFLGWLVTEAAKDDRLGMRHRKAVAEYEASVTDGDADVVGLMDFFGLRGLEFDPDLASEETDELSELRTEGDGGRAAGVSL